MEKSFCVVCIKHDRMVNIVGEFAREVCKVQYIELPVFVYVCTDQLFFWSCHRYSCQIVCAVFPLFLVLINSFRRLISME